MPGSLVVGGCGLRPSLQLTPEVRATLETADRLFFAVSDPLGARWLAGLHPRAESLGDLYQAGRPRLETYELMVERILAPVRAGERVCAVFYGHPGVFVRPSHEAIRRARAEGFEAEMLPGISSEDCLFADLGIDPAASGCQTYEATDLVLTRPRLEPTAGLVVWQIGAIGNQVFREGTLTTAAAVELLVETLLANYPSDHQVVVYEACDLPIGRHRSETVPLAALPTIAVFPRSTLWVPPTASRTADPRILERLMRLNR